VTPFVKERPAAPPGFFEAEAAGLAWLAAAGGAAVVRVEAVAPGRIVLERLDPGAPSRAAARAFGAALARTHAAGAAAFGVPPEAYTGPTYLGNQPLSTRPDGWPEWGAFYAGERVLPYARRAAERKHLSPDALRLVERACERIAAGDLDDDEPPARLHGDLWNGNVQWTERGAVLIDPAAHGGHRETDLAMLDLFGCPYLGDVVAAYDEAAPLRDGWRDRLPLHQLHPLAVHAASHGASYAEPLMAAARSTIEL
jgi:fructosamine-3-kinase